MDPCEREVAVSYRMICVASRRARALRHAAANARNISAVMGFDDGELAEAFDVTTVRQPLEESGRLGFRHLREAINGQHGLARHVTLGVELVVSATT
jgi:DNA-binding LacI/PurR family transcriptional regulator